MVSGWFLLYDSICWSVIAKENLDKDQNTAWSIDHAWHKSYSYIYSAET